MKELEEVRNEMTEEMTEDYRRKVFDLFKIKTRETAKKALQKAYLTFSTLQNQPDGESTKKRW